MRGYEVQCQRLEASWIYLEEQPEGTYVFIYETPTSTFPEKDWHYDDTDGAMRFCENEYGIVFSEWRDVKHRAMMGPIA